MKDELINKIKSASNYERLLYKYYSKQKIFNWKKYGSYLDDHVNKHPIQDYFVKNIRVWDNFIDFKKDYLKIKKDYDEFSKNIILDSKRFNGYVAFNTKPSNLSLNIYYSYYNQDNDKWYHFLTCLKKLYKNNKLYISSCFWRKKLLMDFETIINNSKIEYKSYKEISNTYNFVYDNYSSDDKFNKCNQFFLDLLDYYNEDKDIKEYIEYNIGLRKNSNNILNIIKYKALLSNKRIIDINKRIKNEDDRIFYVDYYDLFDDVLNIALLYFEDKKLYYKYRDDMLKIDLNNQFGITFSLIELYFNESGKYLETVIKLCNKNNIDRNNIFELYTIMRKNKYLNFSNKFKELKSKYEIIHNKKIKYDDLEYEGFISHSTIVQYMNATECDRNIKEEHVIYLSLKIGMTKEDTREFFDSAGYSFEGLSNVLNDERFGGNILNELNGEEKSEYDINTYVEVLKQVDEE